MVEIAENSGADLDSARVAIVAFHGHAGNAAKMESVLQATGLRDVAFFAPSAPGGRGWWEEQFDAPVSPDDPELRSALAVVEAHVGYLLAQGFDYSQIVLAGFSQGASLVLEHLAQTGRDYLGVVSLSGALLGTVGGGTGRYDGDLTGQHVSLSSHEEDPKVPLANVEETAALLEARGATVNLSVSEGFGHGIDRSDVDALIAVANRAETISLRHTDLAGAVGDDANSHIIGNEVDNRLIGKAGNDLIRGRNGRDVIEGGRNADDLRGGRGHDELSGGSGRDKLHGNLGDDTLDGMDGMDLLDGGGGADTFLYRALADSRTGETDRILDFQHGTDTLDLTRIDADRSVRGNDAFRFVDDAQFSERPGELRLERTDDGARLEGDLDGDGVADFAIDFLNGLMPHEGDILL